MSLLSRCRYVLPALACGCLTSEALAQALLTPVAQDRSAFVIARAGVNMVTDTQSASAGGFGPFDVQLSVSTIDPNHGPAPGTASATARQQTVITESGIQGGIRTTANSRKGSAEARTNCDLTFALARWCAYDFAGTPLMLIPSGSTVRLDGAAGLVFSEVVHATHPVQSSGMLAPGEYQLQIRLRSLTDGVSAMSSGGGMDFSFTVTPCPPDFNGDGLTNPDDLADYITCFFVDIGSPGACPNSDFNGDGLRDPDDLSDFITEFFLFPPCP